MFKANPSKSMTEHIAGMGKGKKKPNFFSKKKSGKSKGKFSLFKKASSSVNDMDEDGM